MKIRSDVSLANRSDVGRVREVNEDYFLYCEPAEEDEFRRRGRLLLVADGMGGHNGGEIASGIAAETARDVFLYSNSKDPADVLAESLDNAHQAILRAALELPELDGMGTTCSAVILKDGWIRYGHVGDSRVYLWRDGKITQLTEDQTMVNRLLKTGAITAEEAKQHSRKNVLVSALGAANSAVEAEFSPTPIATDVGDILLLCSDGLHSIVDDDEIAAMLGEQKLDEACRKLVDRAIERGGPDNITVQLLRVEEVRP